MSELDTMLSQLRVAAEATGPRWLQERLSDVLHRSPGRSLLGPLLVAHILGALGLQSALAMR